MTQVTVEWTVEAKCIGCGAPRRSRTGRFDDLVYLSLRKKHAKGPEIICGWACDAHCAALAVRSVASDT